MEYNHISPFFNGFTGEFNINRYWYAKLVCSQSFGDFELKYICGSC